MDMTQSNLQIQDIRTEYLKDDLSEDKLTSCDLRREHVTCIEGILYR